MNAAGAKKRELPAKETALFKQLPRLYDHKQYKRGIKTADQILKKVPEHGETLAMKGLFLHNMHATSNNAGIVPPAIKEEAFDYVKRGLKSDLFSATCWHVYGLLYRSDKNYEEAMKCYRYALKYESENITVLRDFATLQVQTRDFAGFHETMSELLHLRPSQRTFWIGLAVSYHLLRDYERALKVLSGYEDTDIDLSGQLAQQIEHSEMLHYKNQVIEESGDLDQALKHLDEIEDKSLDRRSLRTKRADLLLRLGRLDEAQTSYYGLVEENPESFAFVHGLLSAKGLPKTMEDMSAEQKATATEIFDDLRTRFPRSNAIKRLQLSCAEGNYLKPMIIKGVPSLFANIKALLEESPKRAAITDIVQGYLLSLRAVQKLEESDEAAASPSTILWVLYFLAQLSDSSNDHNQALVFIDEAIAHTPTLLELYMFKARIYKHAGNMPFASAVMDTARQMDLQDRFINTKSTKYKLRADLVEEAEQTITMFSKQGPIDEKLNDLVEMQCMWFALESADSWQRQGQLGRCLKRAHQIDKHFDDIADDQFDFHTYCMRKLTIRAYLDLLRHEDALHGMPNYRRAAKLAVETYVALFDEPKLALSAAEAELEALSPAERKKMLSKQRKAAAKEAAEAAASGADKKVPAATAVPKDDDPAGDKLVKTAEPLEAALKFLHPLQRCAFTDLNTHILSFDVSIRQKKYLLAFKSMLHSQEMAPAHASTHRITVHFWSAYIQLSAEERAVVNELSRELIEAGRPAFSKDLAALAVWNRAYFEQAMAEKDLSKALAAVECARRCSVEDVNDMLQKIVAVSGDAAFHLTTSATLHPEKLTLANALAIHKLIAQALPALADTFHMQCRALFPLATAFMDEKARDENMAAAAAFNADIVDEPGAEAVSLDEQFARMAVKA